MEPTAFELVRRAQHGSVQSSGPDVMNQLETQRGAQVWHKIAKAAPAAVQALASTCPKFQDMVQNVALSCESVNVQVPGFPTNPFPGLF